MRRSLDWWDLIVGVTLLIVAVMAAFAWSPAWSLRLVGFGAIILFAIAWVLVGRRAVHDEGGHRILFTAIVIVASAVVSTVVPSSAIIQAAAFPILWCSLSRVRDAVIASIALTVLIGAGQWAIGGQDWTALLQASLIEGLSLGASLGLGIWISRVADLSAERKRLLDELTVAQAELAASQREAGVVSERERLAREIHDTIAQTLTGLVLLSQQSQHELDDRARLTAQLEIIEENARLALSETRALVAASAPVELGGGIAAALERLAARFRRETGIDVDVDACDTPELDRDTEVVLLRCAQEGLANIRKHAKASRARLALSMDDGAVALAISDDGVGFAGRQAGAGFGLTGMRDRLALVRGHLDIATSPDGTVLLVSLPASAAA